MTLLDTTCAFTCTQNAIALSDMSVDGPSTDISDLQQQPCKPILQPLRQPVSGQTHEVLCSTLMTSALEQNAHNAHYAVVGVNQEHLSHRCYFVHTSVCGVSTTLHA
jgi:hypothetical protein